MQDIRGRYRSEGEWQWPFNEAAQAIETNDGYAAVEWAADLPGSNGEVGVWGHSYDAWTGWRLALASPPRLKGLFAAGVTVGLLDVTRGILDVGRRLEWCYLEAVDTRTRRGEVYGAQNQEQATTLWNSFERSKWLWYSPLAEIPEEVFAGITPALLQYYDEIAVEFWRFDEQIAGLDIPTCTVTGWWDRFNRGVELLGLAQENAPGHPHKLVVGPWSHSPDGFSKPYPLATTSPDGAKSIVDLVDDFFRPILMQEQGPLALDEGSHVFEIGSDLWRHDASWPPAVRTDTWYLGSEASAVTTSGDGSLLSTPSPNQGDDQYTYDPRDPVMSLMGFDSQLQPMSQFPTDGRIDKLCYVTEALDEPIFVAGSPRVTLWASTDARDTDWVARLIRVSADGVAVNISEVILRAKFRDGYENPTLLSPGKIVEYELELGPVAAMFAPGDRIRLDITSSDFPNYDRNHNTGGFDAADSDFFVANQVIYHGGEYRSALLLPVRG